MATEEQTPEERYDAAMRSWASGGPNRSVMAELELIRALRDMIDSLDAELGRLTDAVNRREALAAAIVNATARDFREVAERLERLERGRS
jgi:hypothetical protein